MAQPTLRSRVDSLEKTVRRLDDLPAQVARLDRRVAGLESQIVELGARMGDEFTAIRGEMATELGLVREEMATKEGLAGLRTEMTNEFAAVRTELGALETRLIAHADRGDAETRRCMRMLFEEYVGRRRTIGEGDPQP